MSPYPGYAGCTYYQVAFVQETGTHAVVSLYHVCVSYLHTRYLVDSEHGISHVNARRANYQAAFFYYLFDLELVYLCQCFMVPLFETPSGRADSYVMEDYGLND